jgi:peptidyl-dipeptidase Dcp
MVLSRGNTLDYAEMYRAFAGHDPDVTPMLEFYGLPVGASAAPPAVAPAPAPAPPPPPTPAKKPTKGERG